MSYKQTSNRSGFICLILAIFIGSTFIFTACVEVSLFTKNDSDKYDNIIVSSLPMLNDTVDVSNGVKLIREAYQQASMEDSILIDIYRKSGLPEDYPGLFVAYERLYYRDSLIRTFPQNLQYLIAPNGFKDYRSEMEYFRLKACEYLYAHAMRYWQLSEEAAGWTENDKEQRLFYYQMAQAARSDFRKILSFYPNYKDAAEFNKLARNRAGILLDITLMEDGWFYKWIPQYWKDVLCAYNVKDFNREYLKAVWSGVGYKQERYSLEVYCDLIYSSGIKDTINEYIIKKNIRNTNTGETEQISCFFEEHISKCTSIVRCHVNVFNLDPTIPYFQSPTFVCDTVLEVVNVANNSWATASGDIRALSEEQRKLLNTRISSEIDPVEVLDATFAIMKAEIQAYTDYILRTYEDN